jgi:hypothetical protein
MPYKRRCSGVCALERNEEATLWQIIFDLLNRAIAAIPICNQLMQAVTQSVVAMKNRIDAIRLAVFLAHPPINRVNLPFLK